MTVTQKNSESGRMESVSVSTSMAQKVFRKEMGNNDQSDAKRSLIGLSKMYYKQQPKHLLAKTLEDVIINSFCNYNLDSGCSTENFPSFLYSLVEEMIQFGEDMREKAVHKHGYKRTRSKRLKRPRPASDNALRIGSSCKGGTHITAFKEIPYAKR